MKFEGMKVFGIENALIGMRLPMCKDFDEASMKGIVDVDSMSRSVKLGTSLIKADKKEEGSFGQPNGKFLRMIHAQVAITAPIYWWKEFDTYKVGTTSNSTSTMHKLASTPITKECFEMDDFIQRDKTFETDNIYSIWNELIVHLEKIRETYNETKDKRYWKELIRLLPESWLQTRMIDMDYQTIRNIYFWRKNHKLTEWHSFCKWVESLPYSKEWICI